MARYTIFQSLLLKGFKVCGGGEDEEEGLPGIASPISRSAVFYSGQAASLSLYPLIACLPP
jgi:hypothetical protein